MYTEIESVARYRIAEHLAEAGRPYVPPRHKARHAAARTLHKVATALDHHDA
ncbi:MAG: hypothetical protein ACRDP1_16265 [Nocardioidaceae bacterium]